MANNNMPTDDTIKNGQIYLLGRNGKWNGNRTIADVLETAESELKKSRLTLIPIPPPLKPSSLREDYGKYTKPAIERKSPKPNDPQPQIAAASQDNVLKQNNRIAQNGRANQNGGPPQNNGSPQTPAVASSFQDLPECYIKVLKGICPKCFLLGNILWRNVQQIESRYESRFRPWRGEDEVCFLQFHTMQAPVLADLEVTLALVHHIYVTKTKRSADPQLGIHHSDEQIFAFIYVKDETSEEDKKLKEGGKSNHIKVKTNDIVKEHLYKIVQLYQEEEPKYSDGMAPNDGSIGITPMLFIAALLKWYGFKVAYQVVDGFETLIKIDKDLITEDKDIWEGSIKKKAKRCIEKNRRLSELNRSLTGLRSRVHYVAESARDMMSDDCTMIGFVKKELGYPAYEKIRPVDYIKLLENLDSTKFVSRDNDKFNMIARAMQQYQIDIKSLKVHLTINIGLVSNLYSQLLAEAASRDNRLVLIITVAGLVLLPFTFAAILLTAPVFYFPEPAPDITLRSDAWKYFGTISGSVVAFFIFVIPFKSVYDFFRRRLGQWWVQLENKKEEGAGHGTSVV